MVLCIKKSEGLVMSCILNMAAFHCFEFLTIQTSVTSSFSVNFIGLAC